MGEVFTASVRGDEEESSLTVSWQKNTVFVMPREGNRVAYAVESGNSGTDQMFYALQMELEGEIEGAMTSASLFYETALATKGLAIGAVCFGLAWLLLHWLTVFTPGLQHGLDIFFAVCMVLLAVLLVCGMFIRAGIRKADAGFEEVKKEAERLEESWIPIRDGLREDAKKLGYETEEEIAEYGEATQIFREWTKKAEETNRRLTEAEAETYKKRGRDKRN